MEIAATYNRKVTALKNKLAHFGLDPVDWQLKEDLPGFWVIFSRRNKDMQFLGISTKSRTSWDWKLIQLAI